jgi:hypothetical protein
MKPNERERDGRGTDHDRKNDAASRGCIRVGLRRAAMVFQLQRP